MAGYAIIKLGGKQYVVREGEKLLVDRLDLDENKTFKPDVIFEGGDGKAELSPKGQPVTAKVLAHVQGEKIRIGKYRRRTGYRRHTGFRSKLTQIQIESIGAKPTARKASATTSGTRTRKTAAKPSASTETKA
jgi:large subunit ribosomal protein L21